MSECYSCLKNISNPVFCTEGRKAWLAADNSKPSTVECTAQVGGRTCSQTFEVTPPTPEDIRYGDNKPDITALSIEP